MQESRIGLSSRARQPGEPWRGFCERTLRAGLGWVLVDGAARGLGAELSGFAAAMKGTGVRPAGAQARAAPRAGVTAEPWSLVSSDDAVRRRSIAELLAVGRGVTEAAGSVVIVPVGRATTGLVTPISGVDADDASDAKPATRSSDAQLERLCESLYQLSRGLPEVTWCLTPSEHEAELPLPQDFELVRSELGRRAPSFWHDTGVAALRDVRDGVAQSSWLEGAAGYLAGLTLSDSDGERTGLPPGSGCANLRGLQDALSLGAPLVLGLSADVGEAGLRHARELALRILGGSRG